MQLRQAMNDALTELRGWWLRELRFSPHPLREKMVLFWHGHFTSSAVKVREPWMLWNQNQTFRRHAMGNFRDLAQAMPKDPAMMRYLDISGSTKARPNENFARELMELYLLGEGNYSEEDVREAARAFTGWRVPFHQLDSQFNERQFDNGEKVLFGNQRATTPEEVVDLLLDHPTCAPFVAAKLWTFFTGCHPGEDLAAALGNRFRESGFSIAALLETMFLSAEFYSEEVLGRQIKSPVQWLVGISKTLETDLSGARPELNALQNMGQTLFAPPNVRGWPGGRSWITASTFLVRCRFARQLFTRKNAPNLADPGKLVPAPLRGNPADLATNLCERLLAIPLPEDTFQTVLAPAADQRLPLNDSAICDQILAILSTPEFQLL